MSVTAEPPVVGVIKQLTAIGATFLFAGTGLLGLLAPAIGIVGTLARFVVLSPLALLFAMLTVAVVLCLQVIVDGLRSRLGDGRPEP